MVVTLWVSSLLEGGGAVSAAALSVALHCPQGRSKSSTVSEQHQGTLWVGGFINLFCSYNNIIIIIHAYKVYTDLLVFQSLSFSSFSC